MAYHNRRRHLIHVAVQCRCLVDGLPQVVQGPSTVHFVALQTATGFGIFYWVLCIQSADGGRDREHAELCGRFHGSGLEVAVITVPTIHWSELSHMTTCRCRGGWEI